MHTSACVKIVNKCKITKFARFKFKDFSSRPTFKHLICFQALSRALKFLFQIQEFWRISQACYEPLPSVLWRCWLGGRKGIRPVKKLSGGMLVWSSVWSEVQTCTRRSWCHCHSLSLASVRSRLVLPFWYRLTRVVPDKGPLNGCVCVCVCAMNPGYQPWARTQRQQQTRRPPLLPLITGQRRTLDRFIVLTLYKQ